MPARKNPALDQKRKYETELLRLKVEKECGRLVPVEQSSEDVRKILGGLRWRLLSLHTRFDDPKVSSQVQREVVSIMEDIVKDAENVRARTDREE